MALEPGAFSASSAGLARLRAGAAGAGAQAIARRLLQPARPDRAALAVLALAAACVLVAGFEHARLFHRGYADVEVVGPLFVINAVGSAGVVLALIFDRTRLFVLGSLAICVPSVACTAIAHSWGFFGFRERGFDGEGLVILTAELAAVVLALLGAAIGERARR